MRIQITDSYWAFRNAPMSEADTADDADDALNDDSDTGSLPLDGSTETSSIDPLDWQLASVTPTQVIVNDAIQSYGAHIYRTISVGTFSGNTLGTLSGRVTAMRNVVSINGGRTFSEIYRCSEVNSTLYVVLAGDPAALYRQNDYITGRNGRDAIYGYGGSDVLNGGTGNDTLCGGAGNDSIIGGPGVDIVVFSGVQTEYNFRTIDGGRVEVTHLDAGADGRDILSSVERVVFTGAANISQLTRSGHEQSSSGGQSQNRVWTLSELLQVSALTAAGTAAVYKPGTSDSLRNTVQLVLSTE